MAEETRKIESRLTSLEADLNARDQKAETILWGVAHIFKPPRELLEDIKRADIVTLELPPGAISYRRETEGNTADFWDKIIREIEDSGKKFWAVDANKILRNTRKALARRASAPQEGEVNIFLRDIKDVWKLGLRDMGVIFKGLEENFVTFITIYKAPAGVKTEDLRPEDLKLETRVFIAKPFTTSVKEVCKHARAEVKSKLPEFGLPESAATVLGLDYVYALVMSYEDKTQAEKMLHRLQNFCKSTEKGKVVHVHIGGYMHNSNLRSLLESTRCRNYSVTEKKDGRFPPEGVSTRQFFEKIPLGTRIGLVSIEKNEAILNAGAAKDAFDSLMRDPGADRLFAYLKIDIETGLYNTEKYSHHCRIFRSILIDHLCSKMPMEILREAEERCTPAHYPVKIVGGTYRIAYVPKEDPLRKLLNFLKEKGFKPDPETMQYIKKGRESRCI